MSITALGIGSGLDLSGLLEQMERAERQQLEPLMRQKQGHQSRISAYGRLESALSSFRDAMQALDEPSLFQAATANVSGDALTVSVGEGAAVGNYSIDVQQLARAYSVATEPVDDNAADLGGGTVKIDLANGESLNVELEAGESTLEHLRDAINAEQAGVHASIINDGEGYRLFLASAATGEDAAIANITFGGALSGQLSEDTATEVAARNASLTINSIAIESQTNEVDGVLEGVVLSIAEAGEATLRVEKDHAAIEGAVKDFVSAYNDLQERIRSLGKYDAESGQRGALQGDSALRRIQSQVREVLASAGEGSVALLSDLGISLQLDGTLEVDDDALSEAVAADLPAVSEFFAGVGGRDGLADRVDDVLERILRTDGTLDIATSGLEVRIERLDQRAERMEQSIARTIERYRRQFTQLDSMVAQMQSMSDYLSQQFSILNAQLKRD